MLAIAEPHRFYRQTEAQVAPARPLVLDSFAGAGGLSLGFQLAGFHISGAIEIDKWACETFAFNHPEAKVLQRDIVSVSNEEIRDAFSGDKQPAVLVGGPPCQGFSIANKKAGDAKDPRNSLFREFVRLGALLEPDLLVMENVPNLLTVKTSEGQRVIDIITESLRDIGYQVAHTVLSATDFGIPQIRTRLFIVASRRPLISPFPEPTHIWRTDAAPTLFDKDLTQTPTLWDAISDLPVLEAGAGAEEQQYVDPEQTPYQALLREGSRILFNHKAMNHGKRMVQRFASMECGQSGNDVADELKPRRRNSDEIAVQAYDQNNRRMFPDRPCHTIPASFYANFVHPTQHRNFTAREGARIQSFPDWYRFLGKPTVVSHALLAREERYHERFLCQYSQIGNAVPPMLAKAVAANLLNQIHWSTQCSYTAII